MITTLQAVLSGIIVFLLVVIFSTFSGMDVTPQQPQPDAIQMLMNNNSVAIRGYAIAVLIISVVLLVLSILLDFGSLGISDEQEPARPHGRKPVHDVAYVKSIDKSGLRSIILSGDDIQDGEVVMDEVSDPEGWAQLNEDWDRAMEYFRNGGTISD